jgi:Cu/Ag efflux protein CusF
MKPSRRVTLFALLLLAFAVACRQEGPKPNPAKVSGPAAAVQTTTYHGVGVVKAIKIDAKQPSIEIDHEDIPDLMPAMAMEFFVRDRLLLNGITPGDRIDFTMENGVGGLKITEIKKL